MLGFVGVMSGPRCGSDYVVQLTLAGMPIVGIGIGNIEGGTSPTGGPTAVLRRRVSPSWNKARSTLLAVHSCPRSPSSPRHCATIDTRRSQRPGRSPSRVQPAAEEFTLDARGHRQSRCHPLDGPPLIAPGRFSTFFDDCPHSVNKLDRWISRLWLLDIRPVMYMRSDNH